MTLKIQTGCICVGMQDLPKLTAKDRLEMLNASAARMGEKRAEDALGLLLMPEFFGANYDEGIRTFRPLTDPDRETLLARAQEISREKSWIVIPGTVPIPVKGVPAMGGLVDKASARVLSSVPVYYKGELLATFYKKFYSTGEIACVPTMKCVPGAEGPKPWPVMIPPTNFSSDKLRTDSEQACAKVVPDTFTVEDHEFGIEVCNDIGFLSTTLGVRRAPGCQIVVSYGMTLGYIYSQNAGKYVDRDSRPMKAGVVELPSSEVINLSAVGYEGLFVQCDGPASRCATRELFGNWRLHAAVDLLALGDTPRVPTQSYSGLSSCFVLYPAVSVPKFTLSTRT